MAYFRPQGQVTSKDDVKEILGLDEDFYFVAGDLPGSVGKYWTTGQEDEAAGRYAMTDEQIYELLPDKSIYIIIYMGHPDCGVDVARPDRLRDLGYKVGYYIDAGLYTRRSVLPEELQVVNA